MSPPSSGYRWIILTLIFFKSFVIIGWVWLSLPVFIPYMAEDLGVGPAGAQFIFSAIALSLMVTSFLGGTAGDTFSLKWVIGLGGLVMGGSCFLRALAPGYLGAIVASLIAGLGVGMTAPNFVSALARWFPRRELGIANGVRLAGNRTGAALAQAFVAVYLIKTFQGWLEPQLVLGVVATLLSLLWLVVYRDPNQPLNAGPVPDDGGEARRPALWTVVRELFAVRDVPLLGGIMFLGIHSLLATLGLLPTWVGRLEFVRAESVEFYSSTIYWSALVGGLLLPTLSDRIGRRKSVLYPSIGMLTAGILLIGVCASLPVLLLGIACAGMGGGALVPLVLTVVSEHPDVDPALGGAAPGLMLSVGQIGGTIGPPLGGGALEWGGVVLSTIVVAAPLGVVGIFLVYFLSETGHAAP